MTTTLAEGLESVAACPACDQRLPSSRLFPKSGIWIEECTGCGHRFARVPDAAAHVAAVYGDDYFLGGKAGYADYVGEARLLEAHGRRYGRLLNRFAQPGMLLDLGSAAGFILKGLRAEGWSGMGVEPNATMARYARDQLALDVVTATFEDFAPDNEFDAISAIQVMGHVVEPRRAIAHCRDLLKPGGLCIVETWDVASWSARLFGENWHEYSPPSVLQWWSPESLRRLFEEFGFESLATGRPRKWIEAGHAKSLLKHKSAEGSLAAKLIGGAMAIVPDGVSLPYPSEDLFWAIYRKR